jgi:hypothetical protein
LLPPSCSPTRSQNKTKQNKTKQNKQNKTKQNKTKQNKKNKNKIEIEKGGECVASPSSFAAAVLFTNTFMEGSPISAKTHTPKTKTKKSSTKWRHVTYLVRRRRLVHQHVHGRLANIGAGDDVLIRSHEFTHVHL